MTTPLLDLPDAQRTLLDQASSRLNGYRRNSTYRIDSALRSADAALRNWLRVWLWQHGADAGSADAVVLRERCATLAGSEAVLAATDAVLQGCASLRERPPRHPRELLAAEGMEALATQIAREAAPARALEALRKSVEAALAERVHVRTGDWLRHAHWGLLQVTAVQGLTITVAQVGGAAALGAHDPLMLNLIYGDLERADPARDAQHAAAEDIETFALENSDAEHLSGQHWQPFFDVETLMDHTRAWLADTQFMVGHGSFRDPGRPGIMPWPQAELLGSPDGVREVALLLATSKGQDTLIAAWPRSERGVPIRVTLKCVHVFPDRNQAQIEAGWHKVLLEFYDDGFVFDRKLYVAGRDYEFSLVGIAYSCAPAPDRAIEMGERVRRALIEAGEVEDSDDPERWRIHSRGLAALLPLPDGDRDEHQFHGTVQVVEPMQMLGVPGWRVTVRVLRSVLDGSEAELNLPIIVTERAWKGESPPQPGIDVEGTLWLLGRLNPPVQEEA